jgi:hypothetical protein
MIDVASLRGNIFNRLHEFQPKYWHKYYKNDKINHQILSGAGPILFNLLLVCLVCAYVAFGGWVFARFESEYDVNNNLSTTPPTKPPNVTTATSTSRSPANCECHCEEVNNLINTAPIPLHLHDSVKHQIRIFLWIRPWSTTIAIDTKIHD